MSAIRRGAVVAIAGTAAVALLSAVPTHLLVSGLIALGVASALMTVLMLASRLEPIEPSGPAPSRYHPGPPPGRHRGSAETARRLVGLDPRGPLRFLRELRLRRRVIGACAQALQAIRPSGRDVTDRQTKEWARAAARNHGWQPVDRFKRHIGLSEAALQRLILQGFVIQRGARVRWR